MLRIVTDVERPLGHSTPWSERSARPLRGAYWPLLALAALLSGTVFPLISASPPAGAATISSLQAQANQLQAQIQSKGEEISALGQRYDQAKDQLASIDNQITATKDQIATDQQRVNVDQVNLRSAAIDAYMSDGSAGTANPLFSGNQKTFAAQQEYSQVATGNLDVAVANLHTAQVALTAAKVVLVTQQGSAQAEINAAASAEVTANQQQAALDADLSQVKGELGTLEQEAQAAADAQQSALDQRVLVDGATFPPPPSAGGAAAVAVEAAESQLGVPYVWAGTSPRGTPGDPSGGFDCSGLVMWSWGQAGVDLPHFSGAQFDDTAPVPVADMEPGDILFYGPGGSEHEAMYVGGGEMIEAPTTGEVVHITPIRLGDGFAGVGRP